MMLAKPKRLKDPYAIKETRGKPCWACGNPQTDAHHIVSRGSGGPDALFNLAPLCRNHHTEVHTIGWLRFFEKHKHVLHVILHMGWQLEESGQLWHEKLRPIN